MAEGIKISELEETTSLQDGCCIPVVSNGVNKKILKVNLSAQIVTEARNDIMPRVNEVVNPLKVYSTEETAIGTWIDGKTIYRKCYQYDNEIGINNDVNIDTSITSQVVDRLIKADCCFNVGASGTFVSKSNSECNIGVTNDGVNIIVAGSYELHFKKFIVIIEYTKNTEV